MSRFQIYFALLLVSAVPSMLRAEESVWRVGLLICLSGPCAKDGTNALNGASLAVEDLNAHGGVLGKRVEVVSEDTNEAVNGASAVTAFRRLRLLPDVQYLIGPNWTPAGFALGPIAAKDHAIIITSPSLGVREFNESGDNIFNTRGFDEAGTRKMAHFAIEQGWKRVSVFSSQQEWELMQGRIFSEEFERAGGQILIRVEPVPTASAVQTEALKIAAGHPDAVFFSNYVQQAISAKALRGLRYRGPMMLASTDQNAIRQADGALEGALFYALGSPSAEFAKRYSARYGDAPMFVAATSYDTLQMYAHAITQAGTFNPEAVKKSLLETQLSGVSGEIHFDSRGGADRNPVLKVVRDGVESERP